MKTQHFDYLICSTVYVINNQHEFLLFQHPKLNKWVPPGGKIEPYELPQDTAIRECLEETGFNIQLLDKKLASDKQIAHQGVEFHPAKGCHDAHLDFVFFATLLSNTPTNPPEQPIEWFSLDKVRELDTFPNIIAWCEQLLLSKFTTS